MTDERLIVALDYPNTAEALNLVDQLGDTVGFYKVGMELFYAEGPGIIKELKQRGKKVFLDLKLHDIPNTVGESLRQLVRYQVDLITIHASGGSNMVKRAKEVVMEEAEKLQITPPQIIAVTVLTSISPMEWEEMGYTRPIAEQASILAKMVKRAGGDGVVASPEEARFIRHAIEMLAGTGLVPDDKFTIITPGVRLNAGEANDQARIATPGEALLNGASYLVVGRPIRQAQDPKTAAQAILEDMKNTVNTAIVEGK